jgi:lon-related putative ATP-dependent protease
MRHPRVSTLRYFKKRTAISLAAKANLSHELQPLAAERLRARLDAEQWRFGTTSELEDLTEVIGQARATEAIQFGIGMGEPGYNLYVLSPPGIGGQAVVRDMLAARAAQEQVPSDWCYVNNFEQTHRPRVLRLPPGKGAQLSADMSDLVDDLESVIPAAFESEEYRVRRHDLEQTLKERHEKPFEELGREAAQHGIVLVHTPTGMALAPMREGAVMNPTDFQKLPAAEQERIQRDIAALQQKLERVVEQIPQWRRESQNRIRELDREVVMAAVGHAITALKQRYAEHAAVLDYLSAVERSVIDNADDFRRAEEGAEATVFGISVSPAAREAATRRRYSVNVLIDNSHARGAPVVYADNPSHPELIGRIEHLAQMGALVTDFMLIKPGALHRANGGYLVLDARRVLTQPFAWDGLKRCLSANEIRIESLGQALSLVSTVSLEPEPIPLNLKVVLVGERVLYYLLYNLDPDFRELFKVAADFEEDMDRSPETQLLYARLVATIARREKLRPLDRDAVARVLEHGSRQAADAEKFSIRVQDITDLLREADYWARAVNRDTVQAADVERAIDARTYRGDRVRSRVQQEIQRGTILIDTEGARIGQVNGLSVVRLGEADFGYPTRISARVRLGKGEVVDIQREVELGGPIHSKGVLILGGFLGARYSGERPLSLAASLVFEQTYGAVEGDSASCAELCALLSALAEVPVRQALAITGSVNQHGDVQAIGGVNEKIEGFFDTCKGRGLTGEQGVIIPAANVKHLMLREEVVRACRDGRFSVYPVATADQAIELLTGVGAGEPDASGSFPRDSINGRVEQRLARLAEQAHAFVRSERGSE